MEVVPHTARVSFKDGLTCVLCKLPYDNPIHRQAMNNDSLEATIKGDKLTRSGLRPATREALAEFHKELAKS